MRLKRNLLKSYRIFFSLLVVLLIVVSLHVYRVDKSINVESDRKQQYLGEVVIIGDNGIPTHIVFITNKPFYMVLENDTS